MSHAPIPSEQRPRPDRDAEIAALRSAVQRLETDNQRLQEQMASVATANAHAAELMVELQEAQQLLQEQNAQLELHNRFIRQTFGRYLTNEVVASLLDSPTGLAIGGEKRKVTLLMADLRGFTTLSERLHPEEVVTILNRYLGTMVDVILRYHGTIDEFIGDAILVIFGAPIQRADDAPRAVACAVEMQLAMASRKSKWGSASTRAKWWWAILARTNGPNTGSSDGISTSPRASNPARSAPRFWSPRPPTVRSAR
jgi:Adenylate and Guanylate cyclase catalytic domain